MGCLGGGYLSGNTLVPFPFKDGQCGPWGGEWQEAVNRCFADASVHVRSGCIGDGGWPAIGDIRVNGNAISFKLSVNDSVESMDVVASEVDFPIVRGNASWGEYAIVLYSDGIKCLVESGFAPPVPVNSSPPGRGGGLWFDLCDRCVSLSPSGVTSIRVYDGVRDWSSGPHFVLSGDVRISQKYNMRVSASGNDVTIDAIPGAGAGKIHRECPPVPTTSPIMGRDGLTRLFNDVSFDIEPIGNGHIKLHSKASACCTCEMYRSIVNDRLVPLANAVRKVKRDLNGYLSTYETGVDKFNDRISRPTNEDFPLSLAGMPVGSNLSPKMNPRIKGRMERCAFTATLVNLSAYEVHASITTFWVVDPDLPPPSGSYIPVVDVAVAWMEGSEPRSRAADDVSSIVMQDVTMDPGSTLVATFIARKNIKVGSVSGSSKYRGTVVMRIWYYDKYNNIHYLNNIEKSVSVEV